MSLIAEGWIRLADVDPDYQRLGLASRLHAVLEHEALAKGIETLSVEASHATKPLFERLGYALIRRNLKRRRGCNLVNGSLQKSISSKGTQHENRFHFDSGAF